MVDKIDMSLDDIIKSSKSKRGGARRGRGGTRAGGQRRGGASFRGNTRQNATGGGVMRGRNRGGIARPAYTRVCTKIYDLSKVRESCLSGEIVILTKSKTLVTQITSSETRIHRNDSVLNCVLY